MKQKQRPSTEPFDLAATILASHSADMRRAVQAWVGSNTSRLAELVECVLGDDLLLAQRASWPLSFCVEAHPKLGIPHLARLLQNLHRPGLHGAVVRNTFRLLQFVEIPARLEDEVFSASFAATSGPTDVAVKCCAVSVLKRLVMRFPELRQEVVLQIREQLPGAAPAFVVRVRKEFGLGLDEA
jgi:hypothetical protein